MGEKIPLLQQTVETLRKNEKEDLANELDKLIGELLTHLQNKEKNAITETTQRIDQFLKANKAEIGSELTALASEVEETQKQSSRRSRFWGTDKNQETGENQESEDDEKGAGEESETEEKPSSSFWSKFAKLGAVLGAAFLAFKLWGAKPDANTPQPYTEYQGVYGPKRQEIIGHMNTMIEKDKQNPIGYDFDDPRLGADNDINCSGLVYEVIQKCGCFEMTTGGVTSASLYKSMREKGRPVRPLVTKENTTPDITGIQPGDTIFWASTNPEFSRKNGNCPDPVDGKPIHHSAIIKEIYPDGRFVVLESAGGKGVQVKEYTAQRWLNKRGDELHVVRMPYDPIA